MTLRITPQMVFDAAASQYKDAVLNTEQLYTSVVKKQKSGELTAHLWNMFLESKKIENYRLKNMQAAADRLKTTE